MQKPGRPVDAESLSASGEFLQAGRLHEAKQRNADAIACYEKAGAYGEAARVLGAGGRYRDAGVMLLRSLPDGPTPVDRLSREQRNDALSAAMWFARGGARVEAVGLLIALGEHQRAAGLLQMAGRREDAARAMRGEQIAGSPWLAGTLNNLGVTGVPRGAPSGEIERLHTGPRTPPPPPAMPARSTTGMSTPGTALPRPPAGWQGSNAGGGTAGPHRESPRPALAAGGRVAPDVLRPAQGLADDVSGPYASGEHGALGARATGSHGALRDDLVLPPAVRAPAAREVLPRDAQGARASGTHAELQDDVLPHGAVGLHGHGTASVAQSPRAFTPAPAPPPPRRDGALPPELVAVLDLGGDDPRARAALADVVRLSWDLEPIPPTVVRFIDRQIDAAGRAPTLYNPAVLYAIARLSEVHDRVEAAKLLYLRLSELPVPFQDADFRLSQLQDGLAESADGTWLPPHILVAGFHDYAPKPPLTDLPPLPGSTVTREASTPRAPTTARPSAPPPAAAQAAPRGAAPGQHRPSYEPGVDDETVPPGGPVPVHLRPQPIAQQARWSQPDPGARGGRPGAADPSPSPASRQASAGVQRGPGPSLASTGPVPPGSYGPPRADAASAAPPKKSADETMDFDEYVAHQDAVSRGRLVAVSASSSSQDGGAAGGGPPIDAGALPAGTVIADRYQVENLLGAGGMAVVYRAIDMELEEHVALKLFLQVVQHSDGLARFRREMKLSRKLTHPNIVRIFEFGVWRGARFITMELLKGDDLERTLKRLGGPMPIAQALRLSMQAAEGLGAAHKAGVVHRDVKPQNMFVIDEGRTLKIMDFGIAKANDSASISATDVRVGTPRYMSPEQIQGGQEVGPPADLYALGAVMYEMFTGTRLFKEEDLVPLLMCHLSEEPTPPRRRNPNVPQIIEDVILRLLKKKPEERFSDCGELKKALVEAWVATERLPPR